MIFISRLGKPVLEDRNKAETCWIFLSIWHKYGLGRRKRRKYIAKIFRLARFLHVGKKDVIWETISAVNDIHLMRI